MAEIAIIVEPNFSAVHVGVRRVIQHHWIDLMKKGHNVSLITFANSNFFGATPLGELFQLSKQDRAPTSLPKPDWAVTDGESLEIPSGISISNRVVQIRNWNFDKKIDICKFERTIITNPWMIAQEGFPRNLEFSDGLIHDTIPNQLARSELNFGQFVPVFPFARQHSFGFDFMVDRVERIVSNSEATKNDFLTEYPDIDRSRLSVAIPFTSLKRQVPEIEKTRSKTITILNSLDPRKNFGAIRRTLLSHPNIGEFRIQVIGAARMQDQDTHGFLTSLGEKSESLYWYRQPTDYQLSILLSNSDLLFFPSFYEGLGLPVLEAQSQGIPALTSDTPALAEINQNPDLITNASDTLGMMNSIELVMTKNSNIIYGESLVQKQDQFLAGRTSLVSSLP